jgi:hypothetical protein
MTCFRMSMVTGMTSNSKPVQRIIRCLYKYKCSIPTLPYVTYQEGNSLSVGRSIHVTKMISIAQSLHSVPVPFYIIKFCLRALPWFGLLIEGF